MPSTRPQDPGESKGQPSNSKSKLRALVPAGSFAAVLGDLGNDDDDELTMIWSRPPAPEIKEAKPSLTFQKVDIRDGYNKNGRSEIRLFGVTKAGNSILVRVQNFEHYFYYPAPGDFSEEDLVPLRDHLNDLFQYQSPISIIELEDHARRPGGETLRFLKINLADHRKSQTVKNERGNCNYRDLFLSPELTYEANIPYFLRYMLDNETGALSWLKIPAKKYEVIAPNACISRCQLEVSVDEADLLICDVKDDREKFAPLRILSFDIECNVPENEGQFPSAKVDSVIQVGAMVSSYGQSTPFVRTVFTLGSCDPISGTKVQSFQDEREMLMAWHKFFVQVDPDIIIGYNITQFDVHYLLERAWVLKLPTFPFLGRTKSFPQCYNFSKGRPNFSSCPGYEGRLILDVYHHIREHYRGLQGVGAYKLNNVSQHFLGETKEDIDYKQIPKLQNGDSYSRRSLAIYCLKDVYLPFRLFEKLKCFETELKEARQARVPFNVLRVWKPLIVLAKSCLDALEHQYVIPDK